MEAADLAERFQVEQCIDWIIAKGFKKVILQLKKELLQHSFEIVRYMKHRYEQRNGGETLDIYVTKSNTCCIDLIVSQHISNVDAVVHFGNVCLSKPSIKNAHSELPVLFNLCDNHHEEAVFENNVKLLKKHIISLRNNNPSNRICIFYDTNLVNYAIKLDEIIQQEDWSVAVETANLFSQSSRWYTTANHSKKFQNELVGNQKVVLGYYILSKPIDSFNCAIYLGERLSFKAILDCPSKLFKFNLYANQNFESINTQKVLSKRMALVGRLKDEDELRIGVIITNPLPDINHYMELLESYANARKHTLYFISMIQTIDECKIGNFDLCDAFVVINSCTCSTILESLVFNRPILTDLEFKLACGFEAEYGRVVWPGSSSHLSADDLINKRKVSDVSLALVHMRNELLERCSQSRVNRWSGLDPKASGEGGESLNIDEGRSGIASSYANEPQKEETERKPS